MWDRNQLIAKRAAALLEAGFVVLDLETTSLSDDPQVAIVEVGILDHRGEVVLESYVKPKRRISAKASSIHGIYDKDVAGAPRFEEVYPRLAEILNGRRVVTYNAEFERKVLESVCRQYELPHIKPQEWFCAMRAYSAFRRQKKYFRLAVACKHEGITIENAHRAIGDCRMTLTLMQKMAAHAL
jgi:DNA polymerase-3 subunit epsilon